MRVAKLLFIRLVRFIIIRLTVQLPFAALYSDNEGRLVCELYVAIFAWNGVREVSWDKKLLNPSLRGAF